MEEAKNEIDKFFGSILSEYYLNISADACDFKGEGYAIVGEDEISFFDDKMSPVYKTLKSKATSAIIKGMEYGDITIVFDDNATINAER